ncbi:CapA family protein [Gottfriedia luciferensis]|uniref:CapA family protein n=1 Tax=Gottfriedia luciferensis TaxID=178774 RepID=UPI001F244782|nr:CapA family protein [Gottfriedia luciferensis]
MRKILIVLLICLLALMSACTKNNHKEVKLKENKPKQVKEQNLPPEKTNPIVSKVTVGAVGDILIHNEVYEDARLPNGAYNFNKMFDEVRKTMEMPDILVANQETMIGGKVYGLSTYPTFNSPYEVGDALKGAGVDFVTLANNHALDRGEKIIQSALSHWDSIHMPYTGAFKSIADHDQIRVLNKNNIRFSFLAYTFGTNGIPVPKGKEYLVNMIDLTKIRRDVEKAKGISDVVVVAMHWGTEYERFPNKTQMNLAKQLADLGVQIIIGNHPHVLQPPAWITGITGNQSIVFYSLGNFLSAQDEIYELIGGLATIDVIKTKMDHEEKIELTNPRFFPTYNYYKDNRNFKIMSLQNINHVNLKNGQERYNEIMTHMRSYIKDLSNLQEVK